MLTVAIVAMRSQADFAFRVDDTVPGNIMIPAQGGQSVTHLACLSRDPSKHRNLPVGRDVARRDQRYNAIDSCSPGID